MKIHQKIIREIARPIRKLLRSSISDNMGYPDLCLKASRDPTVFKTFRSDPHYTWILEHVTPELGLAYLEIIRKQEPTILDRIEDFRRNDLYGGPEVADFPGIGSFSPTTLRYIKVLTDLTHYFGPLDGFRIAEIGVGYGGQCRIIQSRYRPASYCLVDLSATLKLVKCYLDHFESTTKLAYTPMAQLKKTAPDLLISNYAFTELTRSIQDKYLEKVILPATRGYITYNDIASPKFKSYKRDELLAMIPGSRIIEEKPLTHPKNCIIVWNRAKA